MRSELGQFKQKLQAQRDATALHLRHLQQPSLAESTSQAASALSASTASSRIHASTENIHDHLM